MFNIARGGEYSYFSERLTAVIVTPAICLPKSSVRGAYMFSSGVMRYGNAAVSVGSAVGMIEQALIKIKINKNFFLTLILTYLVLRFQTIVGREHKSRSRLR